MTTEEFVDAVNAIGNKDEINAGLAPDGTVSLSKCGYSLVAALEKHDIKWRFYGTDLTIPTKILKLMVELAESKEEQPKYVILNGLPRYGMCYYFSVDCDEGKLFTSCVIGKDIEECASFSKERLREAKNALTPELAAAVDIMTVTLERAIELTEQSKHDDLD